ncbi:MAG: hypothetical protein D8M61_11890 [Ignavibacteriae bacterium]|nr:hypothetical protein [Ignavibacteriota bacterium]
MNNKREEKVKNYFVDWKDMIRELNDFSSSVEFLQSRVRDEVVKEHTIDVSEYLDSLKIIIGEHEKNLLYETDRNYETVLSQPDVVRVPKEYVM